QNGCARKVPGMQILIPEKNRDSRKRHAQQYGNESDRAPMRFRTCETAAANSPAAYEQPENGSDLP
ncbi:hypothetical protein ACQ7B2_09370, partial [Escherichia coli]